MSSDRRTPGQPGEYADPGAKAVRPRDAATLIIVRQGDTPRILMGKRAASHKFMPNKFVFPGGRRDPCDSRIDAPHALRAPVLRRLERHTGAAMNAARLRGLALAAIRETFEETGLVLGHAAARPPRSRNADWGRYFAHGVVPPLDQMDFIARAITPTYRTRRFDTRFFLAYAEQLFTDPERINASGELLDLHWLTLDEARKRDLPIITRATCWTSWRRG